MRSKTIGVIAAGWFLLGPVVGAAELHVATSGNDAASGSAAEPLKSIQAAADRAQPGDAITVHAGVYRERVTPPRGGTSDACRIVYQAAPGEKVTITGGEVVRGWKKLGNDTWRLVLPGSYFGAFNPYLEKVKGEWFEARGRDHHRGCVYLNDEALVEAADHEKVMAAAKPLLWFAEVNPESGETVIDAQFPGLDPNGAQVEINVRPTVFTPELVGINYLTVRGFDLRHAATNWAYPTAGQTGLLTAYWCKGWIIENNEISHSRCSGIALGRYFDPPDQPKTGRQQHEWTKEKVGSHLVRHNHIHDCGQAGIVGTMGGAFSRITGNEIHDINRLTTWGGAEMAGIKVHCAIDTIIADNHIYQCNEFGGIWLDWVAEGAQVIGNLLHDNSGWGGDIFCEVSHGPYLIANNILLSPRAHQVNSHGGAYCHNLFAGKVEMVHDKRESPYFKAHSTATLGSANCQLGDMRLYHNLLVGSGSFKAFDQSSWPVVAVGNVFTKGAGPSKFEAAARVEPDFDPDLKLVSKNGGWYLTLTASAEWTTGIPRQRVTAELLGTTRVTDLPFENPDGSPVNIGTDYFGRTRSNNPTPGPFEPLSPRRQEIKVWPKE